MVSAFPMGNYMAGIFGALTAIHRRERSGRGQIVDVALYEPLLRITESVIVRFDQTGQKKPLLVNQMEEDVLRNVYPTADGGTIAISCGSRRVYEGLVDAIGRSDLKYDPRFGTMRDRVENRDAIDREVAARLTTQKTSEALEKLQQHRAVAGKVNDIEEVLGDPHVAAREAIRAVFDEQLGSLRMPSPVPKLSETPGSIRWTGRDPGAANEEVFGKWLGLSAEELDALRRVHVICGDMISNIGITGYGRAAYQKRTTRSLFSFLSEAGKNALNSAGLTFKDVDGLAICSFELPPDNTVTAAELFGISVSWAYLGTAGSAGPVTSVINAVHAIETGQATSVLCIGGDNYDVEGHFKLMDNFSRGLRNYGTPLGFGGANGLFGIIQRKHMESYGTRREALGRISVDQRRSAQRSEHAMLRGPLTIDDCMNARIIADPIRLYNCVLPCAGAEAVVVTMLDRAPSGKGVKVLSGFERNNHPPMEIAPLRGGWEIFADRLFAEAGYGPKDMDFVQLYDDYPIMMAIQLEDLGFCKKGEVSRFLAENSFFWEGSLPLNTGGGQLCCGQAGIGGGLLSVTEAVRQLRGEGGDRQVRSARRGLVAGYGMVGYGHGLASSSIILEAA